MRKNHRTRSTAQALNVVQSVFIVLGIGFAMYYGVNETKETVYFVFAILAVLESILSVCAIILRARAKEGVWVNAVYVLSGILCIPITLFAMFWLLNWSGLGVLPPSQR